MTSTIISLYGSYPDGYKRKIAYMGPTLTVVPRGPPERRGLTHYDCSEPTYKRIYPDSRPSRSSAYTGPTLMATRKNSLHGSYPGTPWKTGTRPLWLLGVSL